MLEVIDLHFDYENKPLLKNIQFRLDTGCLLHLRGSNGSGKTTLLKLIAGLLHPAQGSIVYDGHLINDDLANYQQNLCYVGHKTGVSPLLTIRENCEFDLHYGRKKDDLDELMHQFALQDLADEICGLLSAGQRRRVGLLRLLLSNARLWLLDEPLVALDNDAITALMTCLTEHLETGGQVILSSHQSLPLQEGKYQGYWL